MKTCAPRVLTSASGDLEVPAALSPEEQAPVPHK
jgi:hypothetical protein